MAALPDDIKPSRGQWSLVANTQTFNSPLNRVTQRVELPGAAWTCTYTYQNVDEDNALDLIGFLDSLNGQAETCDVYDFANSSPRGVATGSPVVSGSAQTGTTLNTDGWDPSITNILKRGDKISFGGELKRITADVNSTSDGGAILSIAPSIRTSPSNNLPITTVHPTCTMILIDDKQVKYSIRPGSSTNFYNFTLSFREAF